MYGDADHSAERVVQGDEADGPDVDAKSQNSQIVDGYTDSADLIGEDQRGSWWRSQVTGNQEASGS